MKKGLIILSILLILTLVACSTGTKNVENDNAENLNSLSDGEVNDIAKFQLQMPDKGDTIAIIKTTYGDIKVRFFPEETPLAFENFTTHAKEGYYDNLTFHRVINDFMIQGGDPAGNGTGGESIWGNPFKDEFSNKLYNIRGALCMANSSQKRGAIYSSNGSQFFIMQKKTFAEEEYLKEVQYDEGVIENYKNLGGACWLDLAHTVFGQVFEGMDVVDKIAEVKVDENTNAPLEAVLIETIQITEYE